jgi:hypothetical protein
MGRRINRIGTIVIITDAVAVDLLVMVGGIMSGDRKVDVVVVTAAVLSRFL